VTEENSFKSGFVAVLGRPNVGKSTLVNRLVGAKVSITSPRPQTTRGPIRGVRNDADYQVVFVDTPGSQKPRDTLRSRMQQQVLDSLSESDVVLVLFDVTQARGSPGGAGLGTADRYVARIVAESGTPAIACLNKMDLLRNRSEVLPLVEDVSGLAEFEEIFPLSAVEGLNVEPLLEAVVRLLPPGPRYFPEGAVTDYPESLILAEYIREKALLALREEVPHAIAVEIDEVKRKDSGVTVVYAIIYVERGSQRMIVLGKGGKTIKQIGTEARREVERLLGTRIYLDLKVKVAPGWRNDPRFLERLGL
jgi:GTP-binding protein Era